MKRYRYKYKDIPMSGLAKINSRIKSFFTMILNKTLKRPYY